MRNFIYLLTIILAGAIISCQKDLEINVDNTRNDEAHITNLPRDITDCGYIPELCYKVIYTPQSPFMSFGLEGGGDPQFVSVNSTQGHYYVYPYNIFSNSKDYVVQDDSGNFYFLLETQDTLLQEYNISNLSIPIGLNIIANLDYDDLLENSVSLSEAQTALPQSTNVTEQNGVLTINIDGLGSGDVSALARYNWCALVKVKTIEIYKEELASAYDVINPADWRLNDAIQQAVEECIDPPCINCPDSRCVIDAIIENPLFNTIINGEEVRTEIKLNYLRLLLDLNTNQTTWLRNNPAILDELIAIYDLFQDGKNSTRTIGCDADVCGAEGAAQAHINLLMNNVDPAEIDASKLCSFYTSLYNSNKNAYNCLIESFGLEEHLLLFETTCSMGHPELMNSSLIDELFNSCGCPIGGTTELENFDSTDEFIEDEPKWGQLGNCSEIIAELGNIDLSGNLQSQINNIDAYFDCQVFYERPTSGPDNGCLMYDTDRPDFCLVKKYLYTEERGWIDMLHVFRIFRWAMEIYETGTPGSIADIFGAALLAEYNGYNAESWQWVNSNYSAFSYEDLCSNHVGAIVFVSYYEELNNGQITWQQVLGELCNDLNAKEPSEAPNYEYIPYVIDEKYPKVFNASHCLKGTELEDAGKANFCNMKLIEQLKLKEAHSEFPD